MIFSSMVAHFERKMSSNVTFSVLACRPLATLGIFGKYEWKDATLKYILYTLAGPLALALWISCGATNTSFDFTGNLTLTLRLGTAHETIWVTVGHVILFGF